MKTICLFLLFSMNLFTCGCQTDSRNADRLMSIGYDLSAPDRVYFLPRDLLEISGITEMNDDLIACIQDEKETVFFYDLNKNEIIRQFSVGDSGDYEDIARVDRSLYILRSDGIISEITDYESGKIKSTVHETGIPWKDNEGFCYDRKNNRLLISPKEVPGKDSGKKKMRFIYGFSLNSDKLIKDPIFIFDIKVIESFALAHNIKVPVKGKKNEGKKPDIELRMSAIGIHPITGRLFALSGAERLLFVFDMNGNIGYIEKLKSDLFRQPEGITFMKNGDMYISNEGKKKSATLIRFNYKPEADAKPGK